MINKIKKISFLLGVIGLLIFPYTKTFAVTDSMTGFINGDIWYSQAKFVEGDDIKIYTGFWNGEKTPVSVKVSFFDQSTLLGEREIIVPALTLKDVSISWKVTAGDHQIKAQIIKATTNTNGINEEIVITNKAVETKALFVPKKITPDIGTEKLSEIGEKVIEALPEEVAKPIETSVEEVDDFRQKTAEVIKDSLEDTKKKIEEINTEESSEVENSSKEDTEEIKTEVEGLDSTKEDSSNTDTSNKKTETKKSTTKTTTEKAKTDSLSGTEKPIAYIQLFLLSVALFIFSHAWLFYGIILILIFFVGRFIIRKIRGR